MHEEYNTSMEEFDYLKSNLENNIQSNSKQKIK
jgi:hypothetical protein